jgi:hypothetical protein
MVYYKYINQIKPTMTSLNTIQNFIDKAEDAVGEIFYNDTWRSTSFLIQLLNKTESYYESLNADHPDEDYYTAQVATSSALELINNSYTVPTDDDRYELVQKMYDATVNHFIVDLSDDAVADLIFLGAMANFVAGMRTHAVNAWIESTGPSEEKFEMLKLAKRDEKAVELAVKTAAEVLLAD